VKVLEAVPAIFTKDKAWAGRQLSFILRPGSIVVLPEDAILVLVPEKEGSHE